MKALVFIACVILIVLIFGYWHSRTHSSFYVSLSIAGQSDRTTPHMPDATVQFLDSKGSVLAKGFVDKQYSFVHLVHPVFGDCHDVEKMAAFSKEARKLWHECFEHQSTWIARWITDVTEVTVQYGGCLIKDRPITVSRSSSNWYLWWVPLPHIGGSPYSDYSARIVIDEKECEGRKPL